MQCKERAGVDMHPTYKRWGEERTDGGEMGYVGMYAVLVHVLDLSVAPSPFDHRVLPQTQRWS